MTTANAAAPAAPAPSNVTPPAVVSASNAAAPPQKPLANGAIATEGKPTPKGSPKSAQWNKTLSAQQRLLETEGKLKDLGPKAAQFEAIQAKLKTDPLGALADLGIGYDVIAKAKMKAVTSGTGAAPPADPPPETKELKEKIEDVNKRLTAAETASQTAAREAQDQQWKQYVGSIDAGIKGDPEKYPALNLLNASQIVVDEIMAHFDKTQKLMTPEDAAKAVEERLAKELQEFAKTNPKVLALLGVAAQEEKAEKGKAPSGVGRRTPAKTLDAGTPVGVARPGGPAPITKPAVAPPSQVRKHAPSGVRGAGAESFAEWRARKYKEQAT